MSEFNPNDEILAEYQQRFLAAYDRMVEAIEKKQAPAVDDFKLMRELHYIMTEYRRDPFQKILITKLTYDPDRYKEVEHVLAYTRDNMAMLKWWYEWKPGALFV